MRVGELIFLGLNLFLVKMQIKVYIVEILKFAIIGILIHFSTNYHRELAKDTLKEHALKRTYF